MEAPKDLVEPVGRHISNKGFGFGFDQYVVFAHLVLGCPPHLDIWSVFDQPPGSGSGGREVSCPWVSQEVPLDIACKVRPEQCCVLASYR